ncbi:MAG: GDSL-type esterase/lipase family protein [Blautia massiliensis (ex Durand et al. 2017)]|nr:MAG: GDSL family lipase [Subdoligranulum variabile]
MQTIPLNELPAVRVLGRSAGTRDAPALFYTGSGIECLFTGSELHLHIRAGFSLYEPWLSVELNGAWIARFPVPKGESEICLFRGMSPGTPKHLRVLKDVQAMHDDPDHFLQITGLSYPEGRFLPLPEPAWRLEFVGDSITSGEGALGATCEEDWISAFFSAFNNYARQTADALGAEWRIVSQSGWGLLSSWDNDPHNRVMDYYDTVCGLAAGPHNAALGAQKPYDFAAWPADAVILNLGTNDENAMARAPWTDPETGAPYAQRPTPEHLARLEQAAVDALKKVRARNPGAVLVWAFGMLGERQMGSLLRRAVARYAAENGDTRAFYLPLPAATPQTLGARNHPGAACHRQAAEVLADFLRAHLPARG